MSPDVSVLVPSVSAGPELAGLASALVASAGVPAEVVIADNGLATETLDALAGAGARIVAMGANRGFGAAVNAAARAAAGRVLVVTNDDARPEDGFVGRLAAPILAGEADITAGVLLMAEDPGRVETAGVEVDAVLSGYDYLHGAPASGLGPDATPPLGPCGGAAGYSAELFATLGGYDEGFFAYCEDVDLALRSHAAGARVALATDARARHATSASTGYRSLRKAEMVGDSRGYLLRKYGVLRRPSRAARVLATEALVCLELARRHRTLAPARARVRGYRRGLTSATVPALGPEFVGLGEGLRRRWARSVRPSAD